jgi:hypothetical protein
VRQGRPVSLTVVIGARKPVQNRGKLSLNLTGSFYPNSNGIIPELTPANPRLLMGLGTEMLTPPRYETPREMRANLKRSICGGDAHLQKSRLRYQYSDIIDVCSKDD